MSDSLIKVNNVSKKFCRSLRRSLWYGLQAIGTEITGKHNDRHRDLRADEFWALEDVSFSVRKGECLGLIGRNGAGKTTLLRMLNGLIKPDHGKIELHGRVGGLIALGAGFNPILTGRENIYVNASVLGLTRRETDGKIDEIIDFSEIDDFIDMPVQNYSSGMQVRLGFSIATALKPDILLLDEVLAVGDADFRSKSIKRVGEILQDCAVIFVSHDPWQVRRICDSVLWLKHGGIAYQGSTETGMLEYAKDSIHNRENNIFINTINSISNVHHKYRILSDTNPYGDETIQVNMEITFDSTESIQTGLCIGNIITADEVAVGQFDFSRLINSIDSGSNSINLYLPDVQLSKGEYSLTISIYDESNKQLILNIRRFCHILFKNNIRYGCNNALSVDLIC